VKTRALALSDIDFLTTLGYPTNGENRVNFNKLVYFARVYHKTKLIRLTPLGKDRICNKKALRGGLFRGSKEVLYYSLVSKTVVIITGYDNMVQE